MLLSCISDFPELEGVVARPSTDEENPIEGDLNDLDAAPRHVQPDNGRPTPVLTDAQTLLPFMDAMIRFDVGPQMRLDMSPAVDTSVAYDATLTEDMSMLPNNMQPIDSALGPDMNIEDASLDTGAPGIDPGPSFEVCGSNQVCECETDRCTTSCSGSACENYCAAGINACVQSCNADECKNICRANSECAGQCSGRTCRSICRSNSRCEHRCTANECTHICRNTDVCVNTCAGQNCRMRCREGAACQHTCNGNLCEFECSGGSHCEFECQGQTCRADCTDAASCSLTCMAGHCEVSCGNLNDEECILNCESGSCQRN